MTKQVLKYSMDFINYGTVGTDAIIPQVFKVITT